MTAPRVVRNGFSSSGVLTSAITGSPTELRMAAAARARVPPSSAPGKARVAWIDTLKGVGMLLVMLGHTSFHWAAAQWIYTFHMPLFFFASGMFFKVRPETPWRSWIRSRARSLVVPFLFFGLLDFAFVATWSVVINPKKFPLEPVRATTGLLLGIRDSSPGHGTLWFVSCLACMEALLLATTIAFPTRGRRAAAVVGLALVGFVVIGKERLGWYPYSADIALLCVPFMWLGGEFRRLEGRFDAWNAKLWFAPALLAASLVALKPAAPNLYYGDVGPVWLFHARAVLGIAALVAVCKRLPESAFLSHIGRNSLVYLALHQLIGYTLIGTVVGRLPIPATACGAMLSASLMVAGTILIVAPASIFLSRYAPRLVGRGRSAQTA